MKILEYIIFLFVIGGCGILFYSLGVYAKNKNTPMGFYSGTDTSQIKVTDLKKHNYAHSRMWKKYSLYYFVSVLIYFINPLISISILIFSCTIGLALLIKEYKKIEKDYIIK